MQVKLENNEVVQMSQDDSPYTIVGETNSSYSYQGIQINTCPRFLKVFITGGYSRL